jgi:hypothetical protein
MMSSQARNRREVVVLLSVLFLISAAVIWIRTETVSVTYQYVRQEKQFRQVVQDIQAERVKWLRQTAPGKLEAMASSLGLYPPTLGQVIKVNNSNRSLQVP